MKAKMRVGSEEIDNLGLPQSSDDTVNITFRIEAVTSFFLWGEAGDSYITVDLTGGPSYPLIYTDELYEALTKELGYD